MKSIEDIEDMLKSYSEKKAEIKHLDLEIEELKETGGDFEEIERIKRSTQRIIRKIDNMVTILTPEEKEFIEFRYMEGRKMKEVGAILGLSKDGCSSKRRSILSKLATFINNTSVKCTV